MEVNDDFVVNVRYLVEHIGLKMTAYACGLATVRPVRSWLKGKRPTIEAEMRARYAYRTVLFINEAYGGATAKSWLFGRNTRLNRAPAKVLRKARTIPELEEVVAAAKAFAFS